MHPTSKAMLFSSALAAALMTGPGRGPTTLPPTDNSFLDPVFLAGNVCRAKAKQFSPALLAGARMAMRAALAATDDDGPPLWDNLGSLSRPITAKQPQAQRYFDQGLRLSIAFNHVEALRAFRKAQAIDPDCAMCYWGEAFALGANINMPMMDEAVSPAVIAIAKARARAGGASAAEQAMIEALAQRYSADASADKAGLANAYAEAMAAVHARFPDDHEIAVLFADAVMNTTPWNYWQADGKTANGMIGAGIAAIEKVLSANPDHPGAIHAYIHLTEASADPWRAEPFADRLGALMPGAGHLVHMPAHTYLRIGRYADSIAVNRAAVAADEAYLAQVEIEGPYPAGYYPHNIHFVLASAQLVGDKDSVMWAIERLKGKVPEAVAAEIGWLQNIVAAPYYAHAQFSDPDTVLGVADPGDGLPLVKAIWHYARAVAFAAKGDGAAAEAEAATIATIKEKSDWSVVIAWGVPAPDILSIAEQVVAARIAQAKGDANAAVAAFEQAVRIQDTLPYMEPAHWYYPVRQSLGAALLAAGRADEAARVFQQALVDSPNNGWALYGLAQAQQALGDQSGRAATEAQLDKAWLGDRRALGLARL